MKRLRRIAWNGLAAVSSLFFVAATGLAVRSCIKTERFALSRFADEGDRTYWTWDEIRFGRGGVGFNNWVQSGDRKTFRKDILTMMGNGLTDKVGFWHKTYLPEYPNFRVGVGDTPVWGGFKYGVYARFEKGFRRPAGSSVQIVVPLWIILPLLAALPAVWVARWRRTRFMVGHCQACGYDLRATLARCPECGLAPKAVQ